MALTFSWEEVEALKLSSSLEHPSNNLISSWTSHRCSSNRIIVHRATQGVPSRALLVSPCTINKHRTLAFSQQWATNHPLVSMLTSMPIKILTQTWTMMKDNVLWPLSKVIKNVHVCFMRSRNRNQFWSKSVVQQARMHFQSGQKSVLNRRTCARPLINRWKKTMRPRRSAWRRQPTPGNALLPTWRYRLANM